LSLEAQSLMHDMRFVQGDVPEVLTQIYQEDVHLCAYQRPLSESISQYCQSISDEVNLNIRRVVPVQNTNAILNTILPDAEYKADFLEDLALVIDMYAYLFELDEVGMRLQRLDRAMCPRFHTDKLGCRLVTTYTGVGTEWLEEGAVDRSKLGRGNRGLIDSESGLYASETQVHQANSGDVVLLKGDGWYGADGCGVIHRSPVVAAGESRIVLTLDFA